MNKQVEQLQEAVTGGKLVGRDVEFAQDMLRFHETEGRLTDRQFYWVNRLLSRARGEESAQQLSTSVRRVFDLFATAKSHGLKFPKIRLQTGDGTPVVLAQAGERSRYTGQVQITDGARFGSNKYFGRIDTEGMLHDGRDMTPAVRILVTHLAGEPEKVAQIHGHTSGECCFCGLTLTDARSVAVGYGPTCAENFGLAWGERAVAEQTFTIAA